MRKACEWLRIFGLGPSRAVREALDGSAVRKKKAAEYRAEVAEQSEPLKAALRRNHFEPAVVAVFDQLRRGSP